MRQGLHTCLYCCYDSYCKGTNFFSIVYRLATVFGVASVHSPHRVCRVRRKFTIHENRPSLFSCSSAVVGLSLKGLPFEKADENSIFPLFFLTLFRIFARFTQN